MATRIAFLIAFTFLPDKSTGLLGLPQTIQALPSERDLTVWPCHLS